MDERLVRLRENADRVGVFLDFDGVLSEIVREPASATAYEGVVEVVQLLSRRFAVVAVVSGRPVQFLHERLGACDHVKLRGVYGLERFCDGRVIEDKAAGKWRSAVGEGATTAEAELPTDIRIERKGLSFVLHYRGAHRMETVAQEWAAQFSALSGLDAHQARAAIEIGPFLDFDKGRVIHEFCEGLGGAIVFGDDNGDVPMFRAAKECVGENFDAVGVAVVSSEVPPALLDIADITVDGPADVVDLLRWLVD